MPSIYITSTNYNGQTAQVTFYSVNAPNTAVTLGPQTLPYSRSGNDVYGSYELNFTSYDKVCFVTLNGPVGTTTTTTAIPAGFRAIPTLTSNTSSGVANVNTGTLSNAYLLFDGNANTTYYTVRNADNNPPRYFQYTFANNDESLIGGYSFTSSDTWYNNPNNWTLSGSNDGTNFTVIDTRSSVSWSRAGQIKIFTLSSPAQYNIFRWTLITDFNDAYTGLSSVQLLPVEPVGPNDPYFDNVSLLLHFDGEDGSATFTDSSPNNASVARFNSAILAKISTDKSKFGWSSALFGWDGGTGYSGGWIYGDNQDIANFGTDDFCIEMWVYTLGYGSGAYQDFGGTLFDTRSSGSSASGYAFFMTDNGGIRVYSNSATIGTTEGGLLALNTWQHIAFARASGVLRIYVDGNISLIINESRNLTDNNLTIGKPIDIRNYGNDLALVCYMDDVRVTKNSSRGYTGGTITVPTAPFANTGTATTTTTTTTTAAPTGDLFWSDVKLLLPLDSGFTDLSTTNTTFTALGSTTIDTVNKQFGSGSLPVGGFPSGYGISTTNAPTIGTSDFTLEWWQSFESLGTGNDQTVMSWNAINFNTAFMRMRRGNNTQWVVEAVRYDNIDEVYRSTQLFFNNQSGWAHIVIVRQSGTWRVYVNGVQAASAVEDSTGVSFSGASGPLSIPGGSVTFGRQVGSSNGNFFAPAGYIDDIRLTLSVRYPNGTTFNVPTSANPQG